MRIQRRRGRGRGKIEKGSWKVWRMREEGEKVGEIKRKRVEGEEGREEKVREEQRGRERERV